MTTHRIFSGVQPTGTIHLGNYLGAIRQFAGLADTTQGQALYCAVDLHAITVQQDPKALRDNVRLMAATFLATGVDPDRSIIFAQSAVRQHTELAWALNCVARVGWLERMTQFKDKTGENAERASVGLYAYPVLMAADILLYKATQVPVGADQKQHLELARDIAKKFNKDHARLFPPPNAVSIDGPGARIMSLQDATKKMSKSDPNQNATINLLDDADTIARKIKRAQSDSEALPGALEGLEGRPAARNLVGLYAALSGLQMDQACRWTEGMQFSVLKDRLTEIAVKVIVPVGDEMRRLTADPGHLDAVLRNGADRASNLAEETMCEVREALGLAA